VNNLPKVVTWQCTGRDSNLQPVTLWWSWLVLGSMTVCVQVNYLGTKPAN